MLFYNLNLQKWLVNDNASDLGTPWWIRREFNIFFLGMHHCSPSYLRIVLCASFRATEISALISPLEVRRIYQ